jgi:hypothetical protein
MSSIPVLLAYEVDVEQIVAPWRSINPSTLSGLIVVGAIGLVTLLALVWAILFRKRGRRRRSHRHSHHHSSTTAESPPDGPEGEESSSSRKEHRKRRRSRHRHRSLNPTLAQTGGLPPVRPDEPPQPQA